MSNKYIEKIIKNRRLLLPISVLLIVIITVLLVCVVANNKRTFLKLLPKSLVGHERQVVTMKSGKKYYADEIESDGINLKLSYKDGRKTYIIEENVKQIEKENGLMNINNL